MAEAKQEAGESSGEGAVFFNLRHQELADVVRGVRGRHKMPQLFQISGLPRAGKATFTRLLAESLGGTCGAAEIHCCRIHRGMSFQDVVQDIIKKAANVESAWDNSGSARERLLQEVSNLGTPKIMILLFGIMNILENDLATLLELIKDIVGTSTRVTVMMTTNARCDFPRLGVGLYHHTLRPVPPDCAQAFIKLHAQVGEDFHWTYVMDDIVGKCGSNPSLLSEVGRKISQGVEPSEIREMMQTDPFSILPYGEEHWSEFHGVAGTVTTQAAKEDISSMLQVEGSFGLKAYQAVTGRNKSLALTKCDVRSRLLNNVYLSSEAGTSFHINSLMKFMLNQKIGSAFDQRHSRNRFCLYYAQLLQQLTRLLHDNSKVYLPSFLSELGNVERLLKVVALSPCGNYDLFLSVADISQELFFDYMQRVDLISFYETCVTMARQRGDERQVACLLTTLSRAVMMQTKDYRRSMELIREARDLFEKTGEGDCMGRVRLLSMEGWYDYKNGDHQMAVRHYMVARRMLCRLIVGEVQDLDKESLGPWDHDFILKRARVTGKAGIHLWLLSSIDSNIGVNYVCLGKFAEAIEYHKQTLRLQNALWGERHTHTAMTHHKLGLTYHLAGESGNAARYSMSMRHGTRGLDLRKFLIKGASVTVVQSLSLAAMTLLKETGNWKRSLGMLEEALAMRKELGADHPDMGLILNGIGNIHSYHGDHASACDFFRRGTEIYWNIYGIGPNCCTGESLDLLGDQYLALGQHERALATQKRCLAMYAQYAVKNAPGGKASSGPELEHVQTACRKIRDIYKAMGDNESAHLWQDIHDGAMHAIPECFFSKSALNPPQDG